MQACLLEYIVYKVNLDSLVFRLALHVLMALLCSTLHIVLNARICKVGLQQFRQTSLCRLQYSK